ncbi:MAG: nicotinate phosphoribosyltransferase [Elusimicrobia bacterium]|nr:nicotinate phosphoribosyltransferase [Elusimicrobiota bacterium]
MNDKKDNPVLLTDLYELTMMQGYYLCHKNVPVVFDMFFRRTPFNGGYAVFAGLEPLVNSILNFRFTDDHLGYLDTLGLFKPEFLKYLSKFRFTGDLYSVEEGELVFPNEPLVRVHSGIIEAQLLESILLNITNYQTLVATKTARIREAAKGRRIIEFGLRRAQGPDGAMSASRAAFIGGAEATSNVMAAKTFNIPPKGTMAHSWVMSFESESDAFENFARLYPENTILLVDTYSTLKSGIPAAIKVFRKLKHRGIKNFGIRLDSGDLEYISKQARAMLDSANLREAKIVVSNELDEYTIEQLINKKSPIDSFGVGTNLVTAKGDSALTGVYKLVARKPGKRFVPCIKVSDNPGKTTNPGVKNVLRIYGRDKFMLADLIFLEKEKTAITGKSRAKSTMALFHPDYTYKSVRVSGYGRTRALLRNVVRGGKINYEFPSLPGIQSKTLSNLKTLHPTYKRLLNPHVYKVSITKNLQNMKFSMINKWKA